MNPQVMLSGGDWGNDTHQFTAKFITKYNLGGETWLEEVGQWG